MSCKKLTTEPRLRSDNLQGSVSSQQLRYWSQARTLYVIAAQPDSAVLRTYTLALPSVLFVCVGNTPISLGKVTRP
jgi:hypothetical protein